MMRALLTLLALCVASPALAQGASHVLPSGWTLTSGLRRLSDVNGVACSEDRAYARSWGGGVVAWDGRAWSELPELPGTTQGRTYGTGIAVAGAGVIVEASGSVARWDGSAWSLFTRPSAGPYESIGGLAGIGDDVYAVGRGRIERREGAIMRGFDAGTWRDLSAIAGTSASDVWTAGQGGTLMHWDGHGWTRATSGTEVWLGGLVARAAGDVWAWSERSAQPAILLHYDGRGWSSVVPPTGGDVLGVGARGAHVWVATSAGVFERVPTGWTSLLAPADFGDDRHAILNLCATRTHLVVGAGLGTLATRQL